MQVLLRWSVENDLEIGGSEGLQCAMMLLNDLSKASANITSKFKNGIFINIELISVKYEPSSKTENRKCKFN